MKKILFAAAAVGTAASLVILYLKKRHQGENLLEEAKDAMKETKGTMRKFMHKAKNEADGIYSNAMG
jgi:mannitol-specific phosphotransferase system IIBC component